MSSGRVNRFSRRLGVGALAPVLLAGCGGDLLGPDALPAGMALVQAGRDFTCAVVGEGRPWCWGANGEGQLGIGTTLAALAPVPVALEEKALMISTHAFARHACALTVDGDAYCWGENDFGQVGDGTSVRRPSPVPVAGDVTFRSVTAGWRFSCGLTLDDRAYCWGRGEWGQLGDGRATRSSSPVAVSGDLRFDHLEAGSNNTVCGVTTSGDLYCWGLDLVGSLGVPSNDRCTRTDGLSLPCAKTPIRVDSPEGFRHVSVGGSHGCAVTVGGRAECWGSNATAQLGAVTTDSCGQDGAGRPRPCSRVPVPVTGETRFAMTSAGVGHTCGLDEEGFAFCWGANTFGQRGDGLIGEIAAEPIPVVGALRFRAVSVGLNHTCGHAESGELFCWGANDVGQLGTGNLNIGLGPRRVLLR